MTVPPAREPAPADAAESTASGGRLRLPRAGTPAGALLRLVVVAAVVAGICYHLFGLPPLREFGDYYRIDLDVYRIGGKALVDGVALYGPMPATVIGSELPFTYPPLAAIVFAPLAAITLEQASFVLTAISLAALVATVALTLRALGVVGRSTIGWTAAALAAAALLLEPVQSTLDYGQINIALMALVVADCLLPRTPWPRGLLVGLVAAVKLTPAVFVLFFLLRKDIRSVVTTGVGFLAGTAIGFVVTFSDAKQYWTETLMDSDRIGTPAYPANQSLTGMLARLGLDDATRSALWMLCSVVALAVTVVAVRRAFAAHRPALALTTTAVFGLLVSPVSWSHHWVWAVPLLMVFAAMALDRSERDPARRVFWAAWTVAGAALFVIAPHWVLIPGRTSGLGWPLWDQFLASSYVWWGLVTLILVAALPLAPVRSADSDAPQEPATVSVS
ncbi:glycosyltransferase 87 family protein [Rhodococcus sp. NPDC003318]|uniref:glycosyltransferase 87 family protein n=1 Tax=Rhodococcus sp. NPDC003318 TaxID=3364503 RepID=UPI00369977DF